MKKTIKTRKTCSRRGILLPFNSDRHWKLPDDLGQDLQWNQKRATVIWRGAPTGGRSNPRRVEFVKKHSPKHDIWLSHLGTQGKEEWTKYVKNRLSITSQLNHKYILSIEGNDVATNLKWVLASNSVPIMPIPTKESWLLESLLIPFIHYIPVASDLSNLDEVLEWCRANDKICEEVAINGKNYIEEFFNKKQNLEVSKIIYEKYRDMVK